MSWPVALFVAFAWGISVPEYPNQPLPAWVRVLWDLLWWWLGAGILLAIIGGLLLVFRPRKRVRSDELPPSAPSR